MNTILLALNALVSLTGFSTGENYETNEAVLLDIVEKRFGSAASMDTSSISSYEDIYSFGGSKEYVLATFEDGTSSLYSKESCEIVKNFDNYPFKDIDSDFKLYSGEEFWFDFAYYDSDETLFKDLAGGTLDEIKIGDYFREKGSESGKYYPDIEITPNAHKISNSFYFEKLNSMHAQNTGSTCTIIAAEILFGYYDTFYNDTIVSEEYDVHTTTYSSATGLSIKDFSQSPGVDDRLSNKHDFHDYLSDIATNEVGDDPTTGGGMTALNQIKLIEKYLSKRNISYNMNTCEGNLADMFSTRTETLIKNAIDNDRPLITNGKKHSTVAFAYDDDYVWVHTGWGYIAATPWSTFDGNLSDNLFFGCIDIASINEIHIHSNNYYAANKNLYLCPCGQTYSSLDILPENYGFEPQYFFYDKNKTFTVNNINFNTTRLRTGYIENEYINLSPQRIDAGSAYLECIFGRAVRKFDINLSYWQILDKLSKVDSSAFLYVRKKDFSTGFYHWEETLNLLDENLPTDRTNQKHYSLDYTGDEIYGFKISMTAPALGTRNLGRISIGKITLIHSN